MNKGVKAGKVRIIAGDYRGRRIPVPQKPDLRPTPDRVRETLFNWLGQWLDGLVCLDLFAGSGALGFEAASRGAARVVMVENDSVVFESLEKFRSLIGAQAIELVRGDALEYLKRARERSPVQAECVAGRISPVAGRARNARVRGSERALHAGRTMARGETRARRPGELPALRMEKR
jgi:hypothetical protein